MVMLIVQLDFLRLFSKRGVGLAVFYGKSVASEDASHH